MSAVLSRRLARLEGAAQKQQLAPSLRRWLGMDLTPEEHAQADQEEAEREPMDRAAIAADPAISYEVKEWLGAI